MIARRLLIFTLVVGGLLSGATAYGQARPVIKSITPGSGPAGSDATISGRGFGVDNTIYFGSEVIQHVGTTSAIGISCTNSPSCHSGITQSLDFKIPKQLRIGSYRVKVMTSGGSSNAVTFVITP